MGILDKRYEILNKQLNKNPYPWALQRFKTGVANNWTVAEVPMTDDQEQWMGIGKLTSEEKDLVLKNLKFFGLCESLTMDNISLAVGRYLNDGFIRLALSRWSYEEALHSDTFLTISESLNISIDDVYEDWKNIPAIKNKMDFILSLIGRVEDANFEVESLKGKQDFLRDIIGFTQILEGTSFYVSFAQFLSLRRRNKMKGIGTAIDYIMKDETNHILTGLDIILTIIKEYPEVWTQEFQKEISSLFTQAISLEDAYIEETIPDKLVGLQKESFKEYVRFIANRRLKNLGLEPQWKAGNPFPWMSVETDLPVETNFFESRVKEYQTGTVVMDF